MYYQQPGPPNGAGYLPNNGFRNGFTSVGMGNGSSMAFNTGYPSNPFVFDQGQSMVGAGAMPMSYEAKQKEALRKRQNEYSQALEEQIRTKEQQKKLEKEVNRNPISNNAVPSPQKPKGLFDGLGQHKQVTRTNFARGQYTAQVPVGMPMQTAVASSNLNYAHNTTMPLPMMMPLPQMAPSLPAPGFAPPMVYTNMAPAEIQPVIQLPLQQQDTNAGSFLPHANAMNHNFLLSPRQGNGRRIRTDIHGAVDQLEETRRQQQQQKQKEMQQFLMQQIEDKKRAAEQQKRQEEERERKEMEQLRREQERLEQEEAKRKQLKKAQEEADLRLAEEQQQQALLKKQRDHERDIELMQQQELHADDRRNYQPEQQQYQQPQNPPPEPRHHPQNTQIPERKSTNPFINRKDDLFQEKDPPMQSENPPPSMDHRRQRHHEGYASTNKSPFANTKENLFQDPTPPPDPVLPIPPPQYHGQEQDENHAPRSYHQKHAASVGAQPMPNQAHAYHYQPPQYDDPQPLQSFAQEMDPLELKRQYQAMRDELFRQRQLVEQMQQQQQMRPAISSPTLADLDQLRCELKQELHQREESHRREIEQLKRQQDEDKRQLLSLSRHTALLTVPKSEQDQQRIQSSPPPQEDPQLVPRSKHRQRHVEEHQQTDAATSMSLVATNQKCLSNPLGKAHTPSFIGRLDHESNNQCSSPLIATPCGVASSLSCESKFVYFDGKVHTPSEPEMLTVEAEDSLDKLTLSTSGLSKFSVKRVDHVGFHRDEEKMQTQSLEIVVPPGRTRFQIGNNQDECATSSSVPKTKMAMEQEEPDDSLSFFVRDFVSLDQSGSRRSTPNGPCRSSVVQAAKRETHTTTTTMPLLDEIHSQNSLEDIEQVLRRNMRRHEILVQFESRHQHHPGPTHTATQQLHLRNNWMAHDAFGESKPNTNVWTELHDLLCQVRDEGSTAPANEVPEESLVGSSRWMPSPSKPGLHR